MGALIASARHLLSGLLVAAQCLLLGCAAGSTLPDGLVSRTAASPTREEITVNGGGRTIRSLVLLPDERHGEAPPLLLAIHNFAGDASGFAELIHAERLRSQGIVVVLPEAAGWIAQWHGPQITLLDPFSAGVDDVAGLAQTLAVVRTLYGIDSANINIVGFSQGATLALQETRRLDASRPGTVRRLFLVAGSAGRPLDDTLAVKGTDVITYQPGHNGPQAIANFMTGQPGERRFIGALIEAKGCVFASQTDTGGVVTSVFKCADGRSLTHIYEANGEHSWPRQDRKFDSWLMGRGSGSEVDFTDIIGHLIR